MEKWASHPSEIKSITIISKHRIIEIKEGRQLGSHLGLGSVNFTQGPSIRPTLHCDQKRKATGDHLFAFLQTSFKWTK